MILIDMKFPECCFSCGLSHSAFYRCLGCSLTGKTITADRAEKMRMKDCPLVELPPHGRLIDADALKTLVFEALKDAIADGHSTSDGEALCTFIAKNIVSEIDAAPTVIPASEEDE